MKGLFTAVVILALVGIAGFLYRNALEHPAFIATPSHPTVCTQEAMICPDGTAVGRTGPDCAFAPCPVTTASTTATTTLSATSSAATSTVTN